MRYYGAHPAGVAVWKTPEGEWRVSESVTVEDQRAAVVYYGGGHVHVISEEEADELTAAGFGAYITP